LSGVGEISKGPSQKATGVAGGRDPLVEGLGVAHHFVVQQAGFNGTEAAQAPADGGHGLDQLLLDAALGIELLDVGSEQKLEVLARFGGQNDRFRP
jgi:hypothetical protein